MAAVTDAPSNGLSWVPAEITSWSHLSDHGRALLDDGREIAIPAGCPARLVSTVHAGMQIEVQRVGDLAIALRSRGDF